MDTDMSLAAAILTACLLDLLLGDPAYYPHPVRMIGGAAERLRAAFLAHMPNARTAGIATAAATVAGTWAVAWLVIFLLGCVHPALAWAAQVLLIYTAVAMRDLAAEAMAVERRLLAGDLAGARKRLARIVGRDTQRLDADGITRAAVESVAESTVDGVLAPLFWALIGGAPLALAFKAASTLDSMYGYRDDARREFGWAPARLDDAANFLPARIALIAMPAAALLCGRHALASLRIAWRDRARHASPNAAISEAAVAGALGVQLSGPSVYGGELVEKPTLGDNVREVRPEDIRVTCRIMFAASAIFLALGALVRLTLTL